MKQVAVLGSTGSIGVNTLDLVARHPDKYRIAALTANRNVALMFEQCLRFNPALAVMADAAAAGDLETRLISAGQKTEVLHGVAGLEAAASLTDVDLVMAAIVGAAGLLPTLAAVRAGKRVLLANKEALVISGHLFMAEARDRGVEILPIDSEHNAVFQCMPPSYSTHGLAGNGVRRILLTASGGPFLKATLEEMERVTPAQACAHPNWAMGRKISVDSATMMNKGLEVIEAHWLFSASPAQIDVVVHPQSIIHSLVEYVDGSVLAQMGCPDMRTPIAHAMAWPERIDSGVERLDLCRVAQLDFQSPDMQRFPCLRLAFEAIRVGGTAPAVLNAANEVAVEAFLDGALGFMRIPYLVEETLQAIQVQAVESLEQLLEVDRLARATAERTMAAWV